MALYTTKRESTSTRDNTAKEESIEDVIKRMTETKTTSPLESETYNALDPVIVENTIEEVAEEFAQEPLQTEFVEEMEPFPFNQASSEIIPAGVSSESVDFIPMNPGMNADEFVSPAIQPTSELAQASEQKLQELTNHIQRLETTISDLQQTAAAQDVAVSQAQETANTLPVEQITQLIDAPVANLQQGVDQRFMELGARITMLEAAVASLQQSALLLQQNATNDNKSSAALLQGNQQEIHMLTKRLSEIESSIQNQAARISSNESAQALQQEALQQKIIGGNTATANNASIALSQGNQQQIQSLTHRINNVETSLQNHATDISHTEKLENNTTSTGNNTRTNVSTNKDTSHAQIEKDSSGVTIILNKPATAEGEQVGIDSKYRMITHIVVKNDTLWSIAKRYVHNPYMFPELARLSNIKDPNLIYPGNRVRIIQFID
jgi:ribosomal protein S15P/S13E